MQLNSEKVRCFEGHGFRCRSGDDHFSSDLFEVLPLATFALHAVHCRKGAIAKLTPPIEALVKVIADVTDRGEAISNAVHHSLYISGDGCCIGSRSHDKQEPHQGIIGRAVVNTNRRACWISTRDDSDYEATCLSTMHWHAERALRNLSEERSDSQGCTTDCEPCHVHAHW
jgi:hypothetical protein